MRLCTAAQIEAMERYAERELMISPYRLADAAAGELFDALFAQAAGKDGETVILCGAGNNGADGYTLALLCRESGLRASVVAVLPPKSELCAERARRYAKTAAPLYAMARGEEAFCLSLLKKARFVVDCVFGIGFAPERGVPPAFEKVLRAMADADAYVLSADVPSGLSSDDGSFAVLEGDFPALVFAHETLTFSFSKPALCTPPGIHAAGTVRVVPVGLPDAAARTVPETAFLLDEKILSHLAPREPDTSKASFGRLLSYCGSDHMTGAAVLAAGGALRSGVGLVTCVSTPQAVSVLQHKLNEPVFLPLSTTLDGDIDLAASESALHAALRVQSAVLFGCGVGTGKAQLRLLEFLLTEASVPIIIDADGVTLLSQNKELFARYGEKLILTPHPGEMGRLIGTDAAAVQRARIRTARTVSQEYGCVVVLKGYRTVIAAPDGTLAINPAGNPGMAKAGMGDLLAGLVAGFAAQGVPPFSAACLAVYVHARAGDLAKEALGEAAMLPSDTCTFLADAMRA